MTDNTIFIALIIIIFELLLLLMFLFNTRLNKLEKRLTILEMVKN